MRILFLIFTLLFAAPVIAQGLPKYQSTTVNDFAGLLDQNSATHLHKQLMKLRQDSGIEMTVVTMDSQAPYWPDLQPEPFATALFNAWGIGDANRNDGIMILVLHSDRAMRIELGSGFGSEWDRAAAAIIDQTFLPAFKTSNYQSGIIAGTQDVIDQIALPFAHEEPAPDVGGRGLADYSLWAGIAAIFAAVTGWPMIARWLHRLKHCPKCNRRGLRRSNRVVLEANRSRAGQGEQTIWCSHCDYRKVSHYIIARINRSNSSSGGGFGGGSSSGGGASGRW